ncbi:hypothetical protein NFI96_006803 [Prochilodus magdalenae]|nr:hypothetical protein NFI96_006803 [Prochilodus magdalenae]
MTYIEPSTTVTELTRSTAVTSTSTEPSTTATQLPGSSTVKSTEAYTTATEVPDSITMTSTEASTTVGELGGSTASREPSNTATKVSVPTRVASTSTELSNTATELTGSTTRLLDTSDIPTFGLSPNVISISTPALNTSSISVAVTTTAGNTSPTTTTSTSVISTTWSTTMATTSMAVPARTGEGVIVLQVRIQRVFIPAYNDPSSMEYKTLTSNITAELDRGYKELFPLAFLRCYILKLWAGSVGVDTQLIFKNETVLPNITLVAESLKSAVNGSKVFLNIIPSSITAGVPPQSNSPPATVPGAGRGYLAIFRESWWTLCRGFDTGPYSTGVPAAALPQGSWTCEDS